MQKSLVVPLILAVLFTGCTASPGAVSSGVRYVEPADLIAAAKANDWDHVQAIIKERPSLATYTDKQQRQPIHWAVAQGQEETVAFLLAHGANARGYETSVFQMNGLGASLIQRSTVEPIHLAVTGGHRDTVKLLLKHGAVVDAIAHGVGTTLSVAIDSGDESMIELLLNERAGLNVKGGSRNLTPLQYAALKGKRSIAMKLISAGADRNTLTNKKETLLHLACESGSIKLVQYLLEQKVDTAAINYQRHTPLHVASAAGHVNLVALLVAAGSNVDAISGNQETPLHLAAKGGHAATIKALLKNGAFLEATTHNKLYTPLQLAAQGNKMEAVKTLLNAGATINPGKGFSTTPLILAAQNGSVKIVTLLIEKGADVNAINHANNQTAMNAACYRGHEDVIYILLERGVNANVRIGNAAKSTPLTNLIQNTGNGSGKTQYAIFERFLKKDLTQTRLQ